MKKIAKILLALLALILIVIIALPLWDNIVIRPIANQLVPALTKTDFRIGALHINEFNGRITVEDLHLANPPEYEQKTAFSLGRLFFDLDMSTALSDVVVVEQLQIKDVFVSYVNDDKGINNFDQLLSNVNGGYDLRNDEERAAYELKLKADEEKAQIAQQQTETAEAQPEASGKTSGEEKPSKSLRFIVDRIEISGITVQWGPLAMPMPPITIVDLGRSQGGISPDEIWATVYATFLGSMSGIGVSLKDIGVNVGDLTMEKAGKAADAVSEGAGKAAEAVSEGASKAVDAFKGLFK